jgi:hypothetical protein
MRANKKPFEVLNIDGVFRGGEYTEGKFCNSRYCVEIYASYLGESKQTAEEFSSERGIWAASAFTKFDRYDSNCEYDKAVIIQTLPTKLGPRVFLKEMVNKKMPCEIFHDQIERCILDIIDRKNMTKRLHELAINKANNYLYKNDWMVRLDYGFERILSIVQINDLISGKNTKITEESIQIRKISMMK